MALFKDTTMTFVNGQILTADQLNELAIADEVEAALDLKLTSAQLALPDGTKLIGRCSDIAAARTIEPIAGGQLLDVVAYSSGWSVVTNPLGGGRFFYDAADTTSVDDGGVVIVTAGGKRWRRIYNGSVFAEWFGVKSDGATDDTANLRKAIAYAKTTSYPSVRLRQGNTVISDVINLNGVAGTGFFGCKLIGENRKTTAILFKPAAIDSICINVIGGSGNVSSAGVQGLTIKPFNSSYNLLGTGLEINSACYVHVDDMDIQTLNVGYSLHNGTTGGFSEFNIFTRCRAFQNNINRQYIRTLGNDSFHGNRFEGFMNQVKSSGGIGIYVKGRDTSNIAWVYNNRCCDNFFGASGAYAIVLENANTTGVTGDLTAEQDLICKSDDNSWWTQAGRFDSIGNVTFEVTTEIAAKNGRFSWNNRASKDAVVFVNSPLTEASPKPLIQPADIPNGGAHGTVFRALGVGLDAIMLASQGNADTKNGVYIGNINSSGDWQSFNHGFFLSSGGSILRSANGAGFAVQIGTTSRFQFSPSTLRPFTDGGVNLGDASFQYNNVYTTNIVASVGGTIAGNPIVSKVAVPATATSAGVLGQVAADANFLYVCTATNTWKRVAIAAW